jgi:hypothetical protein
VVLGYSASPGPPDACTGGRLHEARDTESLCSLLGYGEHQLTTENTTKVYARYDIDLTRHEVMRLS